MTDIELDAAALERATAALIGECIVSSPIDHRHTETAIRAYLTAIRYPAQRAVVEAAREFDAKDAACDAAIRAINPDNPSIKPVYDAMDNTRAAMQGIRAAVAALEKERTDAADMEAT